MSKIWIDLTDISHWTGHFTGIQRVVYNLADSFDKKLADANFFIYDEEEREFYGVDFKSIEDKFRHDDSTEKEQGIDFRSLALAYYSKIPTRIKKAVPNVVKTSSKKMMQKTETIVVNLKKSKDKAIKKDRVDFQPQDIVVVLGNNWDRDIFMLDLTYKKYDRDLKIYQLVYDLIPSFCPQLFGPPLFEIFTRYMFKAISISDGLLCISKSTEKDVIRFCQRVGLKAPKTKVIRLGDSLPDLKPKTVQGLTKDEFILCVGTVEVRKNHTLLYYAWKEGIRRGYKMPKLVIVGRTGWYTENIRELISHDPETRDLIVLYENTKDAELAWFYQNCKFSVYPSFYEGWGLPIAESLNYGKFCLASNTSSMPEIAGDLIDYFSPFDPINCLDSVTYYMESKTELQKKEKRIADCYRPTSWLKTYKAASDFILGG